MDVFATYILTLAIQKYGQNERSLFSFLESDEFNGLRKNSANKNETYNIADVFDYISYNFYSFLSEVNQDSSNWTALRVAIEKVEGRLPYELIIDASKIVKTIGLLNIFAKSGSRLDKDFLIQYAQKALGVQNPQEIIERLEKLSIIRYAIYKSQYILFEGSDLDIEFELINAGTTLKRTLDITDKLKRYFNFNIIPAKRISYTKGTPRYLDIRISNQLENLDITGEIDGNIILIFNEYTTEDEVRHFSQSRDSATLFGLYRNTTRIADLLFEIDKYDYVLEYKTDKYDRIAKRELVKGRQHIINELNNLVINSMFSSDSLVKWYFLGESYDLKSKTHFNQLLSHICETIYFCCPTYKMEMLNKHKLTSTMSTARNVYLEALLDHKGEPELGFAADKFPPQKTIYKTLLQNTGIYRKEDAGYVITPPTEASFTPLWDTTEKFFDSTKGKAKKLVELYNLLSEPPFKLKQAFCETWVLTYLILRKEDYSLYMDGIYIPKINKEIIDLIIRQPGDYSIKAFDVSGIRLNLFNKYREIINLNKEESIEETSFIETIRPFIAFYKKLPEFTKQTRKLSKNAIDLRDALAKAKDPEETFFVDLPRALGFIDVEMRNNDQFIIDFISILQASIRELRTSYSDLIDRTESFVLESIGIEDKDYQAYKPIIDLKFSSIKEHLLSTSQKTFYSRLKANLKDREVWFNSISYPFLNKPLDSILDEEEEWLQEKLKYSFIELLNYIEIQDLSHSSSDEIFKFDITSPKLGLRTTHLVIPKAKLAEVERLQKKLTELLSSDGQVNLFALIKILDKQL